MGKKLETGVRVAVAASILASACGRPVGTTASPETATPIVRATTNIDEQLDPFLEEEVIPAATYAPAATATYIPTQAFQPNEAIATPEVEQQLVNPWYDYVFTQRCGVDATQPGDPIINCVEKWAEKKLPGGCATSRFRDYQGAPSCNVVATTIALNLLVPPEVFMRIIGEPGITPDVVIEDIYPNLPGDLAIKMDCTGAGDKYMKGALAVFGLEYYNVTISEYSWVEAFKALKPNQVLIVAFIGTNSKGNPYQHYSVAAGIEMHNGHETLYFRDSFFYEDPERAKTDQAYRHHVFFEDSPNIMNDPGRYTGKKFDIVGAFVVERPEDYDPQLVGVAATVAQATEYQMAVMADDDRFILTSPEQLVEETVRLIEGPVEIGSDRYRVTVSYEERESDFYYYDPYGGGTLMPEFDVVPSFFWKGLAIPLYRQNDVRWAGVKFGVKNRQTGTYLNFGLKGCGQAVGASILSMLPADDINPLEFSNYYFSDSDGGGTFPADYAEIFEENGFVVDSLYLTKQAVEQAIDEGKIVMIQGGVNFHWWGAGDGVVDHYVLVLGRDENGELIIHDPYWGVGVTTIEDVDFSRSSGVLSIDLGEK